MKIKLVFVLSLLIGVTNIFTTFASPSREREREPAHIVQQKTIQGVVLDENNEPAIGASVMIKGTTVGTLTDTDGKFQLSIPHNTQSVLVSYIGYHPQVIEINNRSVINVILKEDNLQLEEVVVIGYGVVKKRDLTGAVASVKSDDITIAPTNNVMEALQGRVSGMDITKSSGQVGEDVQILLRGTRSIYGENSPLFIIDGIPGSYNQLNPSDIESIDILKDASSTAIYGSSGANGVVIITTKRGNTGKATVNFDAYYGFSGEPEYFHGMMGDEWTAYRREAYKYRNGQYPADMSSILPNAEKLAAYNAGKWIDWVDEAAGRTAINQKYSLSITGGTDKTKVFTSLSYDNEEGLLKNEDLGRYTMRLNVDQEISPWAKAGLTSNLNHSLRNRGVRNTFTRALSSFPLGNAYDDSGNIMYEFAPGEQTPLGDFIKDQFVDNTRNTYVNSNAFLEILPFDGLSLKTVVSTVLNSSRRGQYLGAQCNANRPSYAGTPYAGIINSYRYGYTWENILSYNNTFAENHNIGATFVTSWNENIEEVNRAEGSGQTLDSWSFHRLLSAPAARSESEYWQTQKMGYAARINYSFMSKYLFTFSNRWDGVSWLSPDNRWDSFPAAAFAWRISDEFFMEKSSDWLNDLKLRVSYGITGNSGGLEAYGTLTNAYAYSSAGISADGRIVPFTQYTGTYGNPSLGWERSHNFNIGLDFALISRLSGSIEYFNTQTKGLLFQRTMPITSGVTGWGSPLVSWENIAETSNKGFELSLNSQNISTKDFRWNTNLTFTWSKEKIESLPSGDLIADQLFEGHAIRSFYDYKYKGIWGTNTPAATLADYGVKPGWVMIETVPNGNDNGVHLYSPDDRQILGHENPDYIVGLNNSLIYKAFDLSLFAMARYGQTINSSLLGWYNARVGDNINQIAGADFWTEDNQNAYYPVPGSGDEQTTMTSLRYRDGSFIKIKNITLGYTIPADITRNAKIERCRIYATAYNPFIYVKDKQLKGTDPETNGLDGFPLFKQFVFGVNITF